MDKKGSEMKTITKNPLNKSNFFATPEDMNELRAVIYSMDRDALIASVMTWNLASKMVDEVIDESEQIDDGNELISYNCLQCNSSNVSKVCDAVWDIDKQNWKIEMLKAEITCRSCGYTGEPRKICL
jgi:preprotein translocase subunit SecA